MTATEPVLLGGIRRLVTLTVDGEEVRVPEGATILDALNDMGGAAADTPTLCWSPNLTPINACRVCVVEVEGSRVLAPSCARKAEDGMAVRTDTERVRHSRRMVLELLASSADMSQASADVQRWMDEYGVDADRYGPPAPPATDRDTRHAGHHHAPDGTTAETVAQPVKVDNDLYVRDYGRCIMCYKCVKACGTDAQFTFAISAAGRGFDARIATELNNPLPDSACVYCGNCIGVCPTGALKSVREHELREAGEWEPEQETVTTTICSFCGVGCNLELHVQQGQIVNVTSPSDHSVTHGHLCIKGRFGFQHVQNLPDDGTP
jgi:NADP-reducing hydrogenase subunit HndD